MQCHSVVTQLGIVVMQQHVVGAQHHVVFMQHGIVGIQCHVVVIQRDVVNVRGGDCTACSLQADAVEATGGASVEAAGEGTVVNPLRAVADASGGDGGGGYAPRDEIVRVFDAVVLTDDAL